MLPIKMIMSIAFFLFLSGCATQEIKTIKDTKILLTNEDQPLNYQINDSPITLSTKSEKFFVFEEMISEYNVPIIGKKYFESKLAPQTINIVTAKSENYFTARSSWLKMRGRKTGVFVFERQWESRVKFAFHAEKKSGDPQTRCFVLFSNEERLNEKNEWAESKRINEDMIDSLNALKISMLEACQ